jgi:hypothetical protein
MTLYLFKVHLQTFLSIPITQKYQILSCETLVANERYYLTNKSIFQHIARLGERRAVYRCLVRKPVGKRPLGRPRSRWEDSIKMEIQEVG